MSRLFRASIFWLCVVLSIILFAYSIRVGLQSRTVNNALTDHGLQSARMLADQATTRISVTLKAIAEQTDMAGRELLSRGTPDSSDLLQAVRAMAYSDPGLVEVGIGFAPFAYDSKSRLYAFSYSIDEDGMHFHDLDTKEDYTKPQTHWYQDAMQGRPVWLEPHFDPKHQQMLVTHAAPIFDPRRLPEPVGVVFATYAVSHLQGVLDEMDLGANGYAFLLSASQHILLHPNRSHIRGRLTLDDLRDRIITTDVGATETIQTALRDSFQTVRFRDADTNLDSRVFFVPSIPPAGWSLGVVLVDRDLLMPPAIAYPKHIQFALLFGCAVVLLTVALSGALRGSELGLWVLSTVFAVCCILSYGYVLWLANDQPAAQDVEVLPITNQNVLNKFISDQRRRTLAQREEVPLFVPAGIYIQSIAFQNATDVVITGYLWQRYTDGIHDNLERGFDMVAASEVLDRQQAHTTRLGNLELVRWSFKATLPQQLNYSRYPIGLHDVSIRLWHKQFAENLILIPDLASYALVNPAARPGLLKGLALSGWEIKRSFFEYRFENYQTSFGVSDSAGLTNFPELYYHITIKKALVGPMIANILPLAVIFILLSTILYLSSHLEAQVSVITACASFFLICVFSHIGLRQSLATDRIVYLEYFYFTTYLMILYVTLNYILWTSIQTTIAQSSGAVTPGLSPLARVVHYRKNLIPRLMFWPLSQLTLLLVTLLTYY